MALLCTGGLFARGALKGRRAYRAVLDRIRTIAGVEAAGFASTVAFGDFFESMPVEAVGGADDQDGTRSPAYRIIGADYFRALGLGMLRGREFTPSEEESGAVPRVAIIDEVLARRLFPTQDPLGQMIRITRRAQGARGIGSANDGEPMQIVGIAPPLRETLFDREPAPHLYVPWGRHYRARMNIHVRVSPPAQGDVLVLSEGVWLIGVGLAIGVPLAALIGLASSRLLYDVSPIDPIVFTLGPLALATAAIVAAWIPARRATRVTPVIALRAE